MPAPSFGLDHLVLLVDDLDEAAGRYGRLGFTVAPQMSHPFGTANRLVMFGNNFLELVGIVDRERLAGPGLLIDKHLATHGPGAFGIALNAQDIEADRSDLAARGIEPGDLGEGSRPVPMPDGRQGLARFSTSLIPGPPQLQAVIFFAQQHVPEVVWIPQWQRHANSARALASIVLSAAEPDHFATYFERLFGAQNVRSAAETLAVRTPLGSIEIVSSDIARERYAWTSKSDPVAQICAASIDVDDLGGIRSAATAAGVTIGRPEPDRLLIPAIHACGIALEFRQRRKAWN